ncbi:MAG: S8 family serine peptidase [Chloroflexota bacterium]
MRYISTYLSRVILLFVLSFFISLCSSAQTFSSEYQDGKLYLKFNDSEAITFAVDQDNNVDINTVTFVKALQQDFTITGLTRPFFLNNDPKLLRTLMLEIGEFNKIEQVIQRLQQVPQLEYVEKVPLDRVYYTPNDSLYNLYNGPQNWNWHLELIHAPEAWDITRGDPNIKVAVVDNAVWVDHPDLAGKIIAQRDVVYGTNNANPPSAGDPAEWSHGTHVAGLIGASSNNNTGVASIGFNVSIIAVKAANNTAPNSISGGYSGIQWAANNGADVINMSWGGTGFSQTNQNLMNTVTAMGVVLIAAAGNDNVSTPHYPSSYQNVISVASIDYNDAKSDFSNYATSVDISSPGGICSPGPSGVLSTVWNEGTMGHYDSYIGTSMACPVVSGLAGLILSVNPALTPAQVEQILESTSDDISAQNPTYIGMLGAGRINAFRAVSSTPFQPTAALSTPVEIITPGTSIDFFSESTGIPTTYQWTFQGGTPSSSNDTNPQNILYQNPGTYDVSLTVTNQFGTSSVTLNDYIQVVTNPSPYIFISLSDSLPCIAESVTLTDNSLYGPTSWEWVIEPSNFEFVNGTSAASQNPQVQFLSQGYFSITLNATNQNGTTSRIFENAVNVQGVIPPYTLDMENATSEYFILWDTIKSQSSVDMRAANNSSWGIHFHGDPIPAGWKGSPTAGTPDQAWNQNLAFQAEARLCGVDARGFTNVKLAFDLRQTYSLGPKYSWFRVLVNGSPVHEFDGTIDFNPTTASDDPWRRVQFDLSEYTGSIFDITLQACNRFSDKGEGEGDNVFIDNIEIVNSVAAKDLTYNSTGLTVYPNPSNGEVNIKTEGVNEISMVEVLNAQGTLMLSRILAPGKEIKLSAGTLAKGLYIVRATTSSNSLISKMVIAD